MNEKYIIIEKNILTEDQIPSKNNEFSDYELYQILEQNGYKTTNKNLQILKEGLNIKKYYILTESEKELFNNNEKNAILNILKSLTIFGFDTKLIKIYEDLISIRSKSYEYEDEKYFDVLQISKTKNGDFLYFYRVIGPYMYSRICFPKENEFFWRSISSNKEIVYKCESDGFTKNINELKRSLISNLVSIKNKRKKISSFKLEDDKSSQKNLPYTIVRNKVLTDDEIRELARKTKKDVIALSYGDWYSDDVTFDELYGWVFTLNLEMTDLPPLADLNDAIYAYSKYKKYNIRPYFDWEGARDPIIKSNMDKVFTVNKNLDDDHIFTAYSGDGDCYHTNRTLKVTKGERDRE